MRRRCRRDKTIKKTIKMTTIHYALISAAVTIVILLLGILLWTLIKGKRVKETYPSGEQRRQYFIRKNKKQGIESVYYKTGELNKSKHWKNGVLDGKCTTFLKDGSVYIDELYDNGKLSRYIVLDVITKEVIYEQS